MPDKDSLWVLFIHTGSKGSGGLRQKLRKSGAERWAIAPNRNTMALFKNDGNFRRYVNKLAEDFNSKYEVVEAEVLPSELRELPCGGYVYDIDDQRRNNRWSGHQANCSNCLALSPNESEAKRRRLGDRSSNGVNGEKPQGDEPTPPEVSDAMKALRSTQRIIVGGTGEFNALLTLIKSLGDEAAMIATDCDTLVSALANLAGAEDRINDLKGQMAKHRETLNQLLEGLIANEGGKG